jgi:transposase, IS5 family
MDRQKDKDARWTKRHGRSHHGYQNHVSIDRRHKLVRRHTVTDAARHDSQALEALLDPDNTASGVWADSAYRSAATEKSLAERGCTSRIHRRPARNRPLTAREQRGNTSSGATPPARACAPGSSTCSPTKRTPWAANWSAPSA